MGLMESIFRKLPAFRGKGRAARILFKRKIEREKDLKVDGRMGCKYILPNVMENIGFDIFINGIYEQETSGFITEKMPVNGVFLDLGANIGAITVPVHHKRKDIQIVCVEAAPSVYAYLRKNLEINRADQVYSINKALFYTDNERVGFYSPDEKFGKGSLSPVFTEKVTYVDTIKLDTLLKELGIRKVDMIKIDVEGFEYHVFKGAESLLSGEDAPDIIFEFVDWAEKSAGGVSIGSAQQLLIDRGYRIFYFNDLGKMKEVEGILRKGYSMLLATKKKVDN
jgi:FkbM family methyltransferase